MLNWLKQKSDVQVDSLRVRVCECGCAYTKIERYEMKITHKQFAIIFFYDYYDSITGIFIECGCTNRSFYEIIYMLHEIYHAANYFTCTWVCECVCERVRTTIASSRWETKRQSRFIHSFIRLLISIQKQILRYVVCAFVSCVRWEWQSRTRCANLLIVSVDRYFSGNSR